LATQLGGQPMLGRAASAAAHEHCGVAGAAMQPAPCTLRSHPSVVMQTSPKLHIRKGCPPASTPGQPALGGGHWKTPCGKQLPEPPPELDPEADDELELEPPPPELEAERDEEAVLPELVPCPPLELPPQARCPVAMTVAARTRSDAPVRIYGASSFDEGQLIAKPQRFVCCLRVAGKNVAIFPQREGVHLGWCPLPHRGGRAKRVVAPWSATSTCGEVLRPGSGGPFPLTCKLPSGRAQRRGHDRKRSLTAAVST
jgi:hypothetical protein